MTYSEHFKRVVANYPSFGWRLMGAWAILWTLVIMMNAAVFMTVVGPTAQFFYIMGKAASALAGVAIGMLIAIALGAGWEQYMEKKNS